jgi:hypothetical protein
MTDLPLRIPTFKIKNNHLQDLRVEIKPEGCRDRGSILQQVWPHIQVPRVFRTPAVKKQVKMYLF